MHTILIFLAGLITGVAASWAYVTGRLSKPTIWPFK